MDNGCCHHTMGRRFMFQSFELRPNVIKQFGEADKSKKEKSLVKVTIDKQSYNRKFSYAQSFIQGEKENCYNYSKFIHYSFTRKTIGIDNLPIVSIALLIDGLKYFIFFIHVVVSILL